MHIWLYLFLSIGYFVLYGFLLNTDWSIIIFIQFLQFYSELRNTVGKFLGEQIFPAKNM